MFSQQPNRKRKVRSKYPQKQYSNHRILLHFLSNQTDKRISKQHSFRNSVVLHHLRRGEERRTLGVHEIEDGTSFALFSMIPITKLDLSPPSSSIVNKQSPSRNTADACELCYLSRSFYTFLTCSRSVACLFIVRTSFVEKPIRGKLNQTVGVPLFLYF